MNFAKSICVTGMLLVIMAVTAMNCLAGQYKPPSEILKLGRSLETEGEKTRALKAYQKVFDLYPNSSEADVALQRILVLKGGDEATKQLIWDRKIRVANSGKNPSGSMFKFGQQFEAEGEKERALKAYNYVLTMYPDSKEADLALQRIVVIKGGDETSQRLLADRKFHSVLSSKNPQTMYLDGVKYEDSNERGRAKKVYLTIMDRFSNHAMAVKAADRLASMKDVEAVEDAQAAARREIERANRDAAERDRQNANERRYADQRAADDQRSAAEKRREHEEKMECYSRGGTMGFFGCSK